MRLSYLVGSVLIICILLLGATYVISRNQNDVRDGSALNNTQIAIPTTNISATGNNHPNGGLSVNVTAAPAGEPTIEDITYVPSGNGQTNTVYYCLQYGTDKYVTDANVTLYTIVSYNRSIQDHDLKIVDIPGNPMHATNALIHGTPVYQFNNVPYGDYLIRAEKNGKRIASGPYAVMSAPGVFIARVDKPDITIPGNCHLDKNTIYGWIRNLKGDYLANVKVSLMRQQSLADTPVLATDLENNPVYSAAGNYAGFFSFENVTPGWYTVSLECDGRSYNNTFNFPGNNEEGFRSDQIFN